jgi:hypothetical protein
MGDGHIEPLREEPSLNAFRKFADVVPRQNQQPDGGNRVDRGPRTTRPRQPERPRPHRAGSAVGEHVLALLAFRSSLDGLRDGSPPQNPQGCRGGGPPARVAGKASRCSSCSGIDRRLLRMARRCRGRSGRSARRARLGAQPASGERFYPRREPAEPPVANAAPEAPSDVCPGGGAGSRGGGTAPATRADGPFSRRTMPPGSSPRPDTRDDLRQCRSNNFPKGIQPSLG